MVKVEGPPGQFNTQTLVFSYFNGVYEQRGTHENRPRYVEMNKFDRKEFYPGAVIPAEIKYDSDSEAWVFSHSKIGKRKEQVQSEPFFSLPSIRNLLLTTFFFTIQRLASGSFVRLKQTNMTL